MLLCPGILLHFFPGQGDYQNSLREEIQQNTEKSKTVNFGCFGFWLIYVSGPLFGIYRTLELEKYATLRGKITSLRHSVERL